MTGGLTFAGPFSVTGTSVLNASGAITQSFVSFATGTLTGASDSFSFSQGTATVGTLSGFTTRSGFALSTAGALTVTGPVRADSVSLGSSGNLVLAGDIVAPSQVFLSAANISQTAGGVATSLLFGSGSAVDLGGRNSVGRLFSFSSQAFSFNNTQSLLVTGPLTAGGATLTVAGDLTFSGPVAVNNNLALAVSGAVAQPGGTLVAGSLSGSAGSLALTLRLGNRIDSLGTFASGGDFRLVDSVPLTVAGAVSVGSGRTLSIADDAPSFGRGGSLAAPGGTVQLAEYTPGLGFTLGGPGSFSATAPVTADRLVLGSATGGPVAITGAFNLASVPVLELRSAGAITESGAGALLVGTLAGSGASAALGGANQVGTLEAFAVGGAFVLNNAQGFTVAGPVVAGSAALTVAGDLVLAGPVTTNALSLAVSGAVVQTAGAVTASRLTGSAASVALTAPGNAVAELGGFGTGGAFALTTATGLVVSGPLTAAGAGLSAGGDLVLAGPVAVSGGLSLVAAGAVSQPGGAVVAASLIGSAAGVSLGSSSNRVGALGAFASSSDFALVDAVPLTVAGAVSAGSGRTLSIASDAPGFGPGGSLSAPGGTVQLAEYTPGLGFTLGGPGSFAAASPVTANRLVLGSVTGGPIAITGAFNLAGTPVLDLRSAGAITESGAGALQVATLSGQAASAALGGANRVGTLGGFTVAGGFVLSNVGGLTVAGPVAGGDITLRSGGDLVLNGAVAARGTLTLLATGAISQPGGSVSAAALTGVAASARIEQAGNTVDTLAGFRTTGDFSFTDGRSLVVTAPVDPNVVTLTVNGVLTLRSTVTGGTVVLNATGGIVEEVGGAVIADVLTGRGASAALGGPNVVGTLGDFTVAGGFGFENAQGLAVGGTVTGAAVSIGAAGPLGVTGRIAAPGVDLRAGADIALGGTVAADTLSVAAPGDVVQTGGSLALGRLTGAAGRIDLGRGGTATIGSLENLVAADTLTVAGQGALRLAGTVSAPFLSVSTTGLLTLQGGFIRTDGVVLAAQTGPLPTPPGSTLAGAGIRQLGTTVVAPLSTATATLRFQLPASGGQVAFNDLQAPRADLVVALGTGTASGALVANNLTVLGRGGTAAFTGTVAQRSGTPAAQLSRISPQFDPAYTLNACALAAPSCTPDNAILFATAAIASILRPDLLTLDVLDLTVTRDRDDPTLLLPNISDRDY